MDLKSAIKTQQPFKRIKWDEDEYLTTDYYNSHLVDFVESKSSGKLNIINKLELFKFFSGHSKGLPVELDQEDLKSQDWIIMGDL